MDLSKLGFSQFLYILAVDQHRHFARAAKGCHVTQPTLSMQLKKLEDELGVTIFDRSKQPVIPTPAGEQVIAQVRLIAAEMRRLPQIAKQSQHGELQGELRVGVIPTLAPYLIPRFVGSFCQRHPKVELEIIEKQTEIILADLQTEQIDCGILAGPLGQVGISEDFLFDESFFLYIASMHHLAKLKYISEANLSTDELWLLEEGHCLRNQVFQLCKHRSKKVAKLPVNFRGGNLESLKSLVQQGFGYTLVPQLAITPADDDLDTIEIRAFREPVPSRRIVLAHRRHQLKVEFFAALSKSIQKSLPRKIREASLQKTKILNPISGDS